MGRKVRREVGASGVADQSQEADRLRVHGLLLASSTAVAACQCLLVVATAPEQHGIPLGREILFAALCVSLGLGAGVLWAVTRFGDGRFLGRWLCAAVAMQGVGGLCGIAGLAVPAALPIACVGQLVVVAVGAPAIMVLWARFYGRYAPRDILVNTFAAFFLFVAVTVPLLQVPGALLPGLVGLLVVGCVADFAAWRHMGKGAEGWKVAMPTGESGNAISDDVAQDAQRGGAMAHRPPGSITMGLDMLEDNVDSQHLGRLFCSISALGCGLYAFTCGTVSFGDMQFTISYFVGAAACLVVLWALAYLLRNKASMTERQLRYHLFDIALPSAAVLAFAIKMVPLEAVSTTLFRNYMEMYFLVLGVAFWAKFVLFTQSNPTSLPSACSLFVFGLAVLLVAGNMVGRLGGDSGVIVLGLVTAAFVILAIIRAGYNLIVYLKGPETAEELARPAPNMTEVCARVSEEYRLTPREAEVLGELAFGHSSTYIAQVLFISNNTARSHMKNIYKKLGVGSREEVIEILRNWDGPRGGGPSEAAS